MAGERATVMLVSGRPVTGELVSGELAAGNCALQRFRKPPLRDSTSCALSP